MSLILEALRKSEAERRRGLAPDVATELPPPPASRPHTLAPWLLPMLVLAAVVVMASWWIMREPVSSASAGVVIGTPDAAPPSRDPLPAMTPRIQRMPATPTATRVPSPELQAPVAAIPTQIAAPKAESSTEQPSRPAPALTAQPPPAPLLPSQAPDDIGNDRALLPPIKLSMHMWDDVPSRRFVILNGQRMAEGDRNDGITVLAIERGGVVVESNGARTRVPLP